MKRSNLNQEVYSVYSHNQINNFPVLINFRGHNVTFLNGFPADSPIAGLQEITPSGLVEYIQNYTNWDLLGARMRGDMPIGFWDVVRYPYEVRFSNFVCKGERTPTNY